MIESSAPSAVRPLRSRTRSSLALLSFALCVSASCVVDNGEEEEDIAHANCASPECVPMTEETPDPSPDLGEPDVDVKGPGETEEEETEIDPEPGTSVEPDPEPSDSGPDPDPDQSDPNPEPDTDNVEPDPLPVWPPTPAETEAAIVEQLPLLGAPGAAACIVKGGEVVWCDGFGLAHVAQQIEVTPQTPFLLASISKAVTAVGVMTQVEAGQIDLDDDATEALPYEIAAPLGGVMSWRALLTHTAGVKDNWAAMDAVYSYPADPDVQAEADIDLQDAVQGYFAAGGAQYDAANFQAWAPGGGWDYSNMGVSLAGAALAEVSGTSFADYMQSAVLTPLGMTRSSFDWSALGALDVAMPYGPANVPYGHYAFSGVSDGGLRASAYDLAKFLAMLIRGGEWDGVQLLQPATVTEMLTPQVPALDPEQGIALASGTWSGDTWWGHSGAEAGTATAMYWRVSDGLGYVLLRNGDLNEQAPGYVTEDLLVAFGETL